MKFLTNNFEWAPSTVADLYRCRWQIEVFFKQIKPQPSHSAGPLKEPRGHNFVQLAISRLLKTKPEMPSLSG